MTPPKADNSSITKPKETEMIEILDKEFKSLVLEMINDLKEDSNKNKSEMNQFKT
jgi:hypothetical protein